MKPFTIHKPTHKFFAPSGTPAIAIGQMRGDLLYINLIGPNGEVTEKTRAVGSCAFALTGHGFGVAADDASHVKQMHGAWYYMFADRVTPPAFCEVVA